MGELVAKKLVKKAQSKPFFNGVFKSHASFFSFVNSKMKVSEELNNEEDGFNLIDLKLHSNWIKMYLYICRAQP